MSDPRTILQRPVITEKATILREGNQYAFKVDKRANKIQIRHAVETIFGVKVESVRTVSVPQKPKRQGAFVGRKAAWKKAYVTLKDGESINVLETA